MHENHSLFSRHCLFLSSGRAAVTLVLLLAVAASSGSCREAAAPALTVETQGTFQYEQFMQMISRTPTAPNSWHVESKVTNNGPSGIEVLPMYAYSEVHPAKTTTFENSATICPKSFAHAFSGERHGITISPEDLSGEIQTMVGLPVEQLDEAPDLSHGGRIAAMVGSHTFTAALTLNAKAVGWGMLSVGPRSTITATWEFGSIWAAPEKVRTDQTFVTLHLGPVIRSASAARAGEAYLVVVTLTHVPNERGVTMKQSSFKLLKLTPTLSNDLSKAFPSNRPSVEEFATAALKLSAER